VEQRGHDARQHPPAAEDLADLVRSLAAVMEQTAVTELDLTAGEISVRLRRQASSLAPVQLEPASVVEAGDGVVAEDEPPGHIITAPMIGTFYASPSPGAPPFVRPGDHVDVGQTIGIIEAMKIMNEIAADRSGVVAAVLVDNGQPVEYGTPLVRLSPGRGERP
jgi:acetyl-CoA carboxylase biotin carboxyl carrier protein